jgi:antirestriction protein ArdC
MPALTHSNSTRSNTTVVPPVPPGLTQEQQGQTRKFDLYQLVTDKIIAAIELGVKRDGKPLWSGATASGMPYNRKSGKTYSGVNVLVLWLAALEAGFNSPVWLTFRQVGEMGGSVKNGSKGVPVVYFSTMDREQIDAETGEISSRGVGFLKSYTVFNVEQCEGIADGIVRRTFQGNDAAEAVLHASGATIIEQSGKAFYRPSTDEVYLPERSRFVSDEAFYAVALHELTHWTGGKTRLARDFAERFGSEAYAFEELIAELGAAFCCADLGLIPATMDDHARYIDSWLRVLKSDRKAIFTAASQASKAHAFLMTHALQ